MIISPNNNEFLIDAKWRYSGPNPDAEEDFTVINSSRYELSSGKDHAVLFAPESINNRELFICDTAEIAGKTYKVTEIKAGACRNMKNLETIFIDGSNLKAVGKDAFKGTPQYVIVHCQEKQESLYTKLLLSGGLAKTAAFIPFPTIY